MIASEDGQRVLITQRRETTREMGAGGIVRNPTGDGERVTALTAARADR